MARGILTGYLVCPMYSIRGEVIGFEARSIHRKAIEDFRLPDTGWSPFWLGTRRAVQRLWAGGDAWVCEGLFDKCPLEWVVPSKDAVVASVRAKLSRAHVEFLRRFCRGWVHMVYDRDTTGREATLGYTDKAGGKHPGALELLERVGLRCRDVPYQGKDPGVIWDQGGVAAMQAAFPL